jgi:hypothetical protein
LAADDGIPCNGVIAAGDTVTGNVVVPDGAHCWVNGAIDGNVYVSTFGSLTLWLTGTVNGNLHSDSIATGSWLGRSVDLLGTVIGNATQNGDGIFGVYAGTVTGNVTIKGNGYAQFSAFGSTTRIGGNIFNDGTSSTLIGSGFGGTITVSGHVMARGTGGGIVVDNWAGTFGVTLIEKSTCALTNALVYGSSAISGKVSASCSPRK